MRNRRKIWAIKHGGFWLLFGLLAACSTSFQLNYHLEPAYRLSQFQYFSFITPAQLASADLEGLTSTASSQEHVSQHEGYTEQLFRQAAAHYLNRQGLRSQHSAKQGLSSSPGLLWVSLSTTGKLDQAHKRIVDPAFYEAQGIVDGQRVNSGQAVQYMAVENLRLSVRVYDSSTRRIIYTASVTIENSEADAVVFQQAIEVLFQAFHKPLD